MTSCPGYQPAPIGGRAPAKPGEAADRNWVKRLAEVVNNVLQGKQNVLLTITLAESETTTVITDSRIGPFSGLYLQPLTAHAAAALYSATSVLADQTTQKNGSVTLDHASLAQTDLTFNLLIIG